VGVGVGPHFPRDLQAQLRDDRPRDRGTQQVNRLVLGLPLEYRESEVAAHLFPAVDDPRGLGPAVLRLLQDRLLVLTRLPQIDVDSVDLIPFVLQPTQDDRSVQPAGISQYAASHENVTCLAKRRKGPRSTYPARAPADRQQRFIVRREVSKHKRREAGHRGAKLVSTRSRIR
jgi:hypothetical protein